MLELIPFSDGTRRCENNGVEVIFGLPMHIYHQTQRPGTEIPQYFSKSRLQAIVAQDRGPEWVFSNWIRDAADDVDSDRDIGEADSSALRVGRAIDTLVFDGLEEYQRLYTMAPSEYPSLKSKTELKALLLTSDDPAAYDMKPWHPNATYCQEWKREKEELGITILTTAQSTWIERAHKAMYRHPEVRAILEDNNWFSQVTFRWRCPLTGRLLQCRPDLVNFVTTSWADLKTTRYWLSEAYGREYFNRSYHLQSFLIDYALSAFCGREVNSRKHLICGKQAYPQVRVWDLLPVHIEAGREMLLRCHNEYARCEASGEWWWTPKTEPLFVPAFIAAMVEKQADLSASEFYDYGRIES